MKPLSILAEAMGATLGGRADISISSICYDSRKVVAGSLFVAIPGTKLDGAQFVRDAVSKGAVAVVAGKGTMAASGLNVPLLEVANPRLALAQTSAAFFASQPPHMVAITGTNGKTSTADFYRQLFDAARSAPSGATPRTPGAASIGTLGLRSGDEKLDAAHPANNTSPDPILLHQTLSELAAHGYEYVAIEASSHGLDQYRMHGVRFEAGAFTNLTRDHLDYHPTMEDYFNAKMRLFDELLPAGATAVVCADDGYAMQVMARCQKRGLKLVTYGAKGKDLRIERLQPNAQGIAAKLNLFGKSWEGNIPLYGAFQVGNLLAACGLAHATGMSMETLLQHLPHMKGVNGRLECAAVHPNGSPIFVDYAHTPDALQTILQTLRAHTQHKLHVVFGCGGDRDKGKRPLMGAIAAQYADVMTVTDDNPRSENSVDIRREILTACPHASDIGDRKKAIAHAVSKLHSGDVLVIAGKGHETYQIIGQQTHYFNDQEAVREAVQHL